jgi:hypothetical protein
MLKTLPNRRGDQASREVSSPKSIPILPNYFDVLLEEEDTNSGDGTGIPGHAKSHGSQLKPKGKSPHVASRYGSGGIGEGDATSPSPEPQGSAKQKREREGVADLPGEGSTRTALELDR